VSSLPLGQRISADLIESASPQANVEAQIIPREAARAASDLTHLGLGLRPLTITRVPIAALVTISFQQGGTVLPGAYFA
jgi:Flp pilus assembly protein CpaB